MKRREFVKDITVLSAMGVAFPSLALKGQSVQSNEKVQLIENLSLTEFGGEVEEYPVLASGKDGKQWLFSLWREVYPKTNDLIKAYAFDGQKWGEVDSVTPRPGQYENPTAACLPDGEPVVAWNTIIDKRWYVEVAVYKNGKAEKSVYLNAPEGNAVNPRLFATQQGNYWVVWENYHDTKFSIFASKLESGAWSDPVQLTPTDEVCFDLALEEGKDGNIYLAYGKTDGLHQNIEMRIFNGKSLTLKKVVPLAIGGELKNRVNLNSKPALSFDKQDRLWISWENNKNNHRLNDSDVYTGDRSCSMVCYEEGELLESSDGKWLFDGFNDHYPTFVNDKNGNLYAFTRCGGDFKGKPKWQFRFSSLGKNGWSLPQTILTTDQKGQSARPSVTFLNENEFFLTWKLEKFSPGEGNDRITKSKINITQFSLGDSDGDAINIDLKPANIEGYHPYQVESKFSGRHRVEPPKMMYKGEEYSLISGCLHEHTELSYCWPAGTDGDLHSNYRFGIYSEGYDFVAITDHSRSINAAEWKKCLRIADFYSQSDRFIAIPATEWTYSSGRSTNKIKYGAGHRNVIFASNEDAMKFLRNGDSLYSEKDADTPNAPELWKVIHKKNIDCVAIPHHPADEVHQVSWEERDEEIEPIVELFQCRGNNEYPGCPREKNLDRHSTTHLKEAFVDYALREKKHKLGFVASGDHNGMGVGLASLWVKEPGRKGIIEALRARRCFATTGDKIFVDMQINGSMMGESTSFKGTPGIEIRTKSADVLEKVELLRNSRVIKTWNIGEDLNEFTASYADEEYSTEKDLLYYYLRVTQKDNEIVWSSPIWIEVV